MDGPFYSVEADGKLTASSNLATVVGRYVLTMWEVVTVWKPRLA